MDMRVRVTSLNEKAVLVKLSRRKATLTRRDADAEEILQLQLNDASLVVSSKLFRDKNNPVRRALAAADEMYTWHKKHTMPWSDEGPRILPNAMYFEYTQEMKMRIAHAESAADQVAANWDQHVLADLSFRAKAPGATRSSPADYPTAEQFRQAIGFDLVFSPLPDSSHFLFDIGDEDKEAFEGAMRDVARSARRDCIGRMLEPVRHLVSKLSVTIGEPGAIFRDSAIENVIEGVELARKLNIDDDLEIVSVTTELSKLIAGINGMKDQVRESQVVRENARDRLKALQDKLAPFMGGAA